MMQQNELFRQFFKWEPGAFDNKAILDNIVKEHPYFGLAQFFLLKNTDKSSGEYTAVAQKASLVFNDDLLMNKQLNERPYEAAPEIREEKYELAATEPEPVSEPESVFEPVTETVAELPAEEPVVTPDTTEPEIMFEPLHASDYFASQGIKLSEDMMGNDKLGKQLKSFTSWLKTMKKVHPDKISETGRATDTAIQTIAEKSNLEEDIVTEAMAEAYILQNKHAKAVDTYEKLSLLNPAKSAYFAAKIESLKK
jgi:hypothetical protein